MKLGLLLAFFLIEASQKPNSESALPASMLPWLVALPIMDAVSVMFFRWYKKRPIMAGDRTHLHHCFIDAGWSGRKTLLLILLISVLLSGVGLQLFSIWWSYLWHIFLHYHCRLYRDEKYLPAKN